MHLFHSIRPLAVLVALGFVLRVYIAFATVGSNDSITWKHFGESILRHGLFDMYRRDPFMNHPPLAGLWSAVIATVSADTRPFWFYSLFKLPVVLADMASAWLLLRIIATRSGAVAGWQAAALYAWSPLAISVSSYHGNTDCIYAFFSLLAFAMVQERRNFWRAGLALGAAINIKLIPLFLLFPLYALCRSRRELMWLTAGLAVCALPFAVVMLQIPELFIQRAIRYNSLEERWGVGFLVELFAVPDAWRALYVANGRYVVLLAVLGLSVWVARGRAPTAYHAGALAMVLFLLLTPGFGVQYLMAALPLLFAANVRLGAAYGLAGGALSTLLYVEFWRGKIPPLSIFSHPYSLRAGWVGLAAYAVLLRSVWRLMGMRNAAGARYSSGPTA